MALDPLNLDNFKLLSNLQGNILKGHGREHTTHIFFSIDDSKVAAAKRWIKKFADNQLTSAQRQLKEREVFKRNRIPAGLFASFYLTAKGYSALGFALPADASFQVGMQAQATKEKLNDPALNEWEAGYQGSIHAMLLLAHDSVDEMGRIAKDMIDEMDRKFARILHVEYGNAIRNENGDGIEHFGYVDGVSQPLFLKDEVEEFKSTVGDNMQWNPEAELDLVLVDDVLAGDATAKGSYFVFRKLEQRVKAFKLAEAKLGEKLHLPKGDERAGAMLVGRFEDGTPVTLSGVAGIIGSGAENNFNYATDDLGARCPFHAHIRKSNPRGSGGKETPENEKKHMMARRGITYGARNVNTNIEPSIVQSPDDGVGLLFMSYQADIDNQFEFIQKNWVNSGNFPKDGDGSDPILEQGLISKGKFAMVHDNAATLTEKSFDSFVTLKGGEYFFAPSVKFLQKIEEL